MSGDHTRFTFRPRNNYAAVGAQQGRVTLDADWNEASDIADRRWRAETVDIVGRAVVPRTDLSPDGVPSAFRILPAGAAFTIGLGRAYVDGLQPENHGGAPAAFDALLAETRGTTAVAYSAQPYLPFPPALPAGRIAVYLDVWQREVTWVEDAEILEKAIGVDTATRTQTVWQVRALGVDDTVTCATPLASVAGFATAHPEAAGRLTTGVVAGPLSTDPCVIAAAGGYRGTENRTYRVQIAVAGGMGGARFCFARDNASVVSRVTGIQASGLTLSVSRIGRDETLRLRRGDWVEITNDIRELHGVAGEIRQIVQDPDEDRLEVTLGGTALPLGVPSAATPFVFSATDPGATHTRIKLWHQRGLIQDTGGATVVDLTAPTSPGTIPVPASSATEIVLGDGVTIRFALEGAGQFRVGDYWVFAARTIDGTVEALTNAPPRGIHHHFAKLAVGTLPTLSDCRTFWPPSAGCCTFVVAPGENIQAAIDALPPQGGCVCLKAGVHTPAAPIRIARSDVTLHGESAGAIVRMPGGGVVIEGTAAAPVNRIAVFDLRFEQGAVAGVPVAALISYANAVRVERCQFFATGYDTGTAVGIGASNVRGLELLDNSLSTFFYGIRVDALLGLLTVRGNAIGGHRITLAALSVSIGIAGIRAEAAAGSAARCVIEGNRLQDFLVGITIGRDVGDPVVRANRIARNVPSATGTMPAGADALRAYADPLYYAIDVRAPQCVVADNDLAHPCSPLGGIRVRAPGACVTGNVITVPEATGVQVPVGIHATVALATGDPAADDCRVEDNRLEGPQLAVLLSRCAHATVQGNRISAAAVNGHVGVFCDDVQGAMVEGNQLRGMAGACFLTGGARLALVDNDIERCGIGVFANQCEEPEIRGNRLHDAQVFGIGAFFTGGAVRIVANRLSNCAWRAPGSGAAVWAIAPIEALVVPLYGGTTGSQITVEGNDIADTGIAPGGTPALAAAAIGAWIWAADAAVGRNRIAYSRPQALTATAEHRALLLVGPLSLSYALAATRVELMGGAASVADNGLHGPGLTHLVELATVEIALAGGITLGLHFERVGFGGNQCNHVNSVASDARVTVRLRGGELAVVGNQVKGPANFAGIHLANRARVTLVANICTGPYVGVSATVRPSPHLNFNY